MRLQGAIFDYPSALLTPEGIPQSGVAEFLALMKIEDVWMYLMTDEDRRHTQSKLETMDLMRFFRGIMVGQEHNSSTVDPELYEKTVRRLRTARRATVIFTGQETVLRAAKAAGFQVVLVQNNPPESLKELADEAVDDYRDMINEEQR